MRAREFIVEGRQRIDEIGPLAIAGWASTVGLGAWQAYDTYKDVEKYNNSAKTEADLQELQASIGMDALALLAGGAVGAVAGKLVGKSIALGATPFKAVVNIYKKQRAAKEAAKLARDAAKKAEKTAPKPGSTVKTPKGDRVAGVDGKPTTIKPKDKAGVDKIKKAAGGTLGKTGSKAPKVSTATGSATGKLTKRAGQGVAKTGKKLLAPVAGAFAVKGAVDAIDKAGEYGSALKDYLGKAMDYEPGTPRKTGKLVYTGSEKNPPVKDFDPGGLGLDYEKTQAPKPKTIDTKTMKKPANPFKALTKQALATTDLDDEKKKALKQKSDEK